MPDILSRPLLSSTPESAPSLRWRTLLLPGMLAILGMLIAWAAVTSGQDDRRRRDTLQMHYDLVYWENQLAQAKLAQPPPLPAEIANLEQNVAKFRAAQDFPPWKFGYAKYGRQFTSWDAYRYEEIIDQGYLYHQPDDPQAVKDDSGIKRPDWPERRLKNVVWYPLYPLLGYAVSHALGISSTNALTAVSWTCCLLASLVMFQLVRRHYFNRAPLAGGQGQADQASLWAVAAIFFGPCSIFFYANFTESLFLLLLACFLYCIQARWWWRAAVIAALASACRSQGVLFGPILALSFLLRAEGPLLRKIGIAALLGILSAIGLACYMLYLQLQFHDALAFMHAQKYWNVGINWQRIAYAANPYHAFQQIQKYGFSGEVDWPRLWQALCLLWPPLLLALGWRYLTFELQLVGWVMWALPYVSNSMAGNPPMDTQWMSMGRFMAVMIPIYLIFGAVFARRPWLGIAFMALSTSAFSVFAYKYGSGAWIG